MPILEFSLSNLFYSLVIGEQNRKIIRYTLTNTDRWQKLKFRDGENLLNRSANFSINLDETAPDFSGTLGSVYYIPAYAGSDDGVIKASRPALSVEYLMNAEVIDQIFESEMANFGPTTVRISIDEGIGYGSAPDGSEKIWESKNNHVPISSLSLIWLRSENGG